MPTDQVVSEMKPEAAEAFSKLLGELRYTEEDLLKKSLNIVQKHKMDLISLNKLTRELFPKEKDVESGLYAVQNLVKLAIHSPLDGVSSGEKHSSENMLRAALSEADVTAARLPGAEQPQQLRAALSEADVTAARLPGAEQPQQKKAAEEAFLEFLRSIRRTKEDLDKKSAVIIKEHEMDLKQLKQLTKDFFAVENDATSVEAAAKILLKLAILSPQDHYASSNKENTFPNKGKKGSTVYNCSKLPIIVSHPFSCLTPEVVIGAGSIESICESRSPHRFTVRQPARLGSKCTRGLTFHRKFYAVFLGHQMHLLNKTQITQLPDDEENPYIYTLTKDLRENTPNLKCPVEWRLDEYHQNSFEGEITIKKIWTQGIRKVRETSRTVSKTNTRISSIRLRLEYQFFELSGAERGSQKEVRYCIKTMAREEIYSSTEILYLVVLQKGQSVAFWQAYISGETPIALPIHATTPVGENPGEIFGEAQLYYDNSPTAK